MTRVYQGGGVHFLLFHEKVQELEELAAICLF